MAIKEHQILRKGSRILLGIALDNAVLDIVTSDAELQECLQILQQPQQASVRLRMGTFGNYAVSLNIDSGDTVSIFVDGPDFDHYRCQSAAIWLTKDELLNLLSRILQGSTTRA